jgi:hypothetical protein
METSEATRLVLMYFVLPLWLAAGFADYLCHRAANIESTSGPKESLLHLLQFGEMGIPVLAALFLEINALVLIVMAVCLILHEATAIWDVSYATSMREVRPIEQHVHSFLEMLPLMGLVLVVVLNWPAFLSLFGLQPADFSIRWKNPPLAWSYVVTMLALVLLFEILPYLEELWRGLRENHRRARRATRPK